MTGDAGVVLASVTDAPLDVAAHLAAVDHAEAGAVTSFVGQVRDHDRDVEGTVARLEYEAHPDAEAVLHDIARRVSHGHPVRVAVSHRVGSLVVGEPAVVIAVSAPHRDTAFEVCRALIETVKAELPLWKRQVDDAGRATWKGIADSPEPAQPPANGGSTSASPA